MGNFIPFADLPYNGTKKDIDKKLDSKFEIVLLGRPGMKLVGIAQIFKNFGRGDEGRTVRAVRKMKGFTDKVSGDLDLVSIDGGSDAEGVVLIVIVYVT